MSTLRDPRTDPEPGSRDDPFRYGWRYVVRRQPDGRLGSDQVPLTLEDLLFPEEGDFAVRYWSHIEDCFYLYGTFQARLADRPGALVLSDCRVRWDVPGLRPLGPDVAVFFGAPLDWDGGTLEVAETGARPVLVVEVTSPETRPKDFGVKKEFYHRAGVPTYVIVDARPGPKGRRVKLHGFRRDPEGYTPMPLDDRGRLWLEPLGLWLTVEDARVACVDGRTGERIAGAKELHRVHAEAEARAEAETARAEVEAARAEAEKVRAEAASTRAEVEAARAEAEAARAEAAESRMIALEAEIRRLRGEGEGSGPGALPGGPRSD